MLFYVGLVIGAMLGFLILSLFMQGKISDMEREIFLLKIKSNNIKHNDNTLN